MSDTYAAAVDRVRLLCDQSWQFTQMGEDCVAVSDLRAALDGPAAPAGGCPPGPLRHHRRT